MSASSSEGAHSGAGLPPLAHRGRSAAAAGLLVGCGERGREKEWKEERGAGCLVQQRFSPPARAAVLAAAVVLVAAGA